MPYPYYGGGASGYVIGGRTADGHGGHASEHRAEMMNIAEMVVARNVPQMIERITRNTIQEAIDKAIQESVPRICAEIYNDSLTRLIGAIQYDVNTAVDISINDFGQITAGSKVSKFISNAIMKELKVKLKNGKGFTIE